MITGVEESVRSTIVEGSVDWHSPSSMIRSMPESLKWSATASGRSASSPASVQSAVDDNSGLPRAEARASAILSSGIRMPT